MSPLEIDLFLPAADSDPADILADHGPDRLAQTLTDPEHRETLLARFVDQQLDNYRTFNRPLRELPIRKHASYHATRLVADQIRDTHASPELVAAAVQRELLHIAERTGTDAGDLNRYLLDYLYDPDLYPAAANDETAIADHHDLFELPAEMLDDMDQQLDSDLEMP